MSTSMASLTRALPGREAAPLATYRGGSTRQETGEHDQDGEVASCDDSAQRRAATCLPLGTEG